MGRVAKMNQQAFRKSFGLIAALAASSALVGCGGPSATDSGSVAAAPVKKYSYTVKSEAGIEVKQDTDTSKLKKLYLAAASKYGPARHDPFALTQYETAFETNQTGERAFNDLNGYQMDYVPNIQDDPVPVLEPQPYRRLAGVVVGDSVLAIIEMGDGSDAQIVRPGQRIPNTEWTVVSIDQEKAVLRRDGDKLPKEITVRLETPKPGTPGYNAGGAGGFQGGAGFPGGPGGGFPGGGGGGPSRGKAGGGGAAGVGE